MRAMRASARALRSSSVIVCSFAWDRFVACRSPHLVSWTRPSPWPSPRRGEGMRAEGRPSIRAGEAEDVFADVGHDQVVVDRGGLVEPGLAELALHVVLLGITVAAVSVDAGVAGVPGRLGRQVLGHVGL